MNLHKLICTLTLVLLFPVAPAADGNRGPVADQDTPPRFAPRAEVYPQQRGNLQLSSVLAPGADYDSINYRWFPINKQRRSWL